MKTVLISSVMSGVVILSLFAGCQKTSSNEYVPLWPIPPEIVYHNLAWSSSANGDMYLELLFRLGDADSNYLSSNLRVYLKKEADSSWMLLPYVLATDISQTGHSIFYTVNTNDPFWYDTGGAVYIYAKRNAAITFNQRAIVGITYLPMR